MQNKFDPKKIAKYLGVKCAPLRYPDNNSIDKNIYIVELNRNEVNQFTLSWSKNDPFGIWIEIYPYASIHFGPINHVHYQTDSPQVIIESFKGDFVSFIELSKDKEVNLNIYTNFDSSEYRVHLHKKPNLPKSK